MQSRRTSGLTPLSIVLPHPALPRRRSHLSLVPSPHTPRSSPTCSSLAFSTNTNRKSTDSWNSWNSSSQDLSEDRDYEWKADQVLLLRRTLDALPPHLMTPFNGPIPPSNLLDKIARGVSQAKGEDWPHSLRATRVKLIELARTIAEEDSKPRKSIPEEPASEVAHGSFPQGDVLQPTTNIGKEDRGSGSRRPLYRQSSMDFLNASDVQDNDSIGRLSKRLQKADRFIPNTSYHPYSRSQMNSRSSSPPRADHVPSLISPSTPSTSTLSSLASVSAPRQPLLRRSASIMSISSTTNSTTSTSRMSVSSGFSAVAADPRVQRVRRSESFCSPVPVESRFRPAVKRAPSYGALAQEARDQLPSVHEHGFHDLSIPDPSSDDEEKMRSRRAKRARVRKSGGTEPPLSPSPAPSSPAMSEAKASSRASVQKQQSDTRVRSTATVKRGIHVFGPELPRLATPAAEPQAQLLSAAPILASPTSSAERVKTLRRAKRLPAARRISFGSLIAPLGEDMHEADHEDSDEMRFGPGLGSAFQLR
ncbi:unnamed protein product [Mycena citricolor]|uniref:Uncharacterized protein n=1 Tax=Mycena citricolor TaxID=2018698 RepID=A0AAD2JYU5_9AGAR|nr:unnamed protein product [Mycena citricolor]